MRIMAQPWSFFIGFFTFYLLSRSSSGQTKWPDSDISATSGHYPPLHCRITHLALDARRAKFLYQGSTTSSIQSRCGEYIERIWPFQRLADVGSLQCGRTFEKAYIFTMYYYYGSNYFHLHYDMMLPLYLAMHAGRKSPLKNVVLMPTVESSRMEVYLSNYFWFTT